MTQMLPNTIHSSVRSGAERRMFNVIKGEGESDGWVCLHSLGLARHQQKRIGEADFVLVTNEGVFVLEVKGGRVRREGGVWVFTDRYGTEHRKTEGPFEQAATAMFSLERDIKAHFKGTRISEVRMGFGVIVPDIEFSTVGPDWDQKQVYDVTDRRNPFRKYVARLAEFWRERDKRRRRGLNKEDVRKLVEFLRADFDLVPSMDTVLDDASYQLLQLTNEQLTVLDALASEPRALIEGPAGSGKTLLAIEGARRSARLGNRVLLICYNKFLAARIQKVLADEFSSDTVLVSTLDSLMIKLIAKSSLAEEFQDRRSGAGDDLVFKELVPEYAGLAVLEDVVDPFDLLIIDEGQDLVATRNLDVIDGALKGGLRSGSWLVFLDSNNQSSIYDKVEKTALDSLRAMGRSQFLTINCRNTQEVAQHTNILAQPRVPSVGRISGPPVEFVSFDAGKDPFDRLSGILKTLEGEGVRPGRVSVLLARSPSQEQLELLHNLGVEPVTVENAASISDGPIATWAVVSGFKGLENDVVLLVGVEDIDGDWWRAVCYVGMSRARSRLYVFLTGECERVRQRRWESYLEDEFEVIKD